MKFGAQDCNTSKGGWGGGYDLSAPIVRGASISTPHSGRESFIFVLLCKKQTCLLYPIYIFQIDAEQEQVYK